MANSYNGEDFESGLLTLSKEVFPTNKYLYQDGQYLDKKTINAYLNPKYTKKEIDKMSENEKKVRKRMKTLVLILHTMVKQTKKNSKTITSLSFKYTRTRFLW